MGRKTGIAAALCAIAAAAVISFGPALSAGFVNWDDDRLVVENEAIRGFGGDHLRAVFGYAHCGTYIPLTLLSFGVDYRIRGLDPAVFHLTNVLIHAFNCLLVFGLVFLLARDPVAAFIAAMLFAVHPLRAESVAWVAERKDVLFVFFYLLALISYVRFARRGPWVYYGASLLAFILSGLAKGTALSLPIVLFLVDWREGRGLKLPSALEKIPFLLCAAGFGLLAVMSQRTLLAAQVPFVQRFFTANWASVFYLWKAVFPFGLSALYPYPAGYPQSLPLAFLLAPIPIAALAFLAGYSLAFSKKFVFGLLFFLVALVPVGQLVTVAGPEIAANRYTYLPLLGVFCLAGEGFAWLWKRTRSSASRRIVLASGTALVVLGLAGLTWGRSRTWRDSVTLWTDVLKHDERIPEAWNNRGAAFALSGRLEPALADFDRALAVAPDFSRALNNRGMLFQRTGRLEKARADFDRAVELDPGNADLRYNRGNLYMATGDYGAAIRDFTSALELDPRHWQAWLNRGNAYCRAGDLDRGISDYDRILASEPGYAEAIHNRAVAFFLKGDYGRAWLDVERLWAMGYPVKPDFLEDLKRALGRER